MYPSLLRSPAGMLADFDALQRQIDWLLGPRGASSSIRAVERGSFPAINVGITPEAVEVYAFAPGIDLASLDVSVDKGLLTIAGHRKTGTAAGSDQPQSSVYAQERAEGAFRRVVSLPEDADPDRVDASYRNGILRIRVDKQAASKPRRIEVRDAGSSRQLTTEGAAA